MNLTTLNTLMNKPELHFYELANNVVAFSSTRHSGVSKGNYAAFNINRYCGDAPDAIEQKPQKLSQLFRDRCKQAYSSTPNTQ